VQHSEHQTDVCLMHSYFEAFSSVRNAT
jgi:hypothetical protein